MQFPLASGAAASLFSHYLYLSRHLSVTHAHAHKRLAAEEAIDLGEAGRMAVATPAKRRPSEDRGFSDYL